MINYFFLFSIINFIIDILWFGSSMEFFRRKSCSSIFCLYLILYWRSNVWYLLRKSSNKSIKSTLNSYLIRIMRVSCLQRLYQTCVKNIFSLRISRNATFRKGVNQSYGFIESWGIHKKTSPCLIKRLIFFFKASFQEAVSLLSACEDPPLS